MGDDNFNSKKSRKLTENEEAQIQKYIDKEVRAFSVLKYLNETDEGRRFKLLEKKFSGEIKNLSSKIQKCEDSIRTITSIETNNNNNFHQNNIKNILKNVTSTSSNQSNRYFNHF